MAAAFDRLSQLVQRELGVDMSQLSPSASLVDLADSLDWVSLLSALEDEFGLRISAEQGMQLRTLADLMDLVGGTAGLRYAAA